VVYVFRSASAILSAQQSYRNAVAGLGCHCKGVTVSARPVSGLGDQATGLLIAAGPDADFATAPNASDTASGACGVAGGTAAGEDAVGQGPVVRHRCLLSQDGSKTVTCSSMDEFDVVAGSGAAGMTAALTAADLGLSVVVIEKAGTFGGSTARSGGGIWAPGNAVLRAAGATIGPAMTFGYIAVLTMAAST